MNLYTKFKLGLLGRRAPPASQVRVSVTREWLARPVYHITDLDGNRVKLDRRDAVVAMRALEAALKVSK